MIKEKIAKVAFNLGVDKTFDYTISLPIEVGSRVLAEFNKKKNVGIIVSFLEESRIKNIKPLLAILDKTPSLSREHLRFAHRLSQEYLYPWGQILFMMLPPKLKRGVYFKDDILKRRRSEIKKSKYEEVFIKSHNFTERFSIYKKEIKNALGSGSVVMFLPTVESLKSAYKKVEREVKDNIIVIHSYQKTSELYRNWLRIKKGNVFVMSTRVGLFYFPLDLNLIVIEEENSPYYFHPEKPYYHLVDVAKNLADLKKLKVILSGDYPTIFTYKRYKEKKLALIEKREDSKHIEILNFGNFYKNKVKIFSPFVIELLRKNLEENRKILIIWNKKNFCSFLKCSNCGYIPSCLRCSSYLKFSWEENRSICSWCGGIYDIEKICSKCGLGYIKPVGVGVERLQVIIKRIFPEYSIHTIEKMTPATNIILSTSKIVNYSYSFDVIFLLDIDRMLSSFDYETTLYAFIYLKKIATLSRDKVYVFTHNPHYYLWSYLSRGWKEFYDRELFLRKKFGFPPYTRLVKITLRAKNKNILFNNANSLYNTFKNYTPFVFGPIKEFPFKLRGMYRYSIVAKFRKKRGFLKEINSVIEHYRRSSAKIAVVIK